VPALSERLLELVQEGAAAFGPGEHGAGGVVLTGAVLVTEWADAAGDPWLVWTSCDVVGRPLARWRTRGLTGEVVSDLDANNVRYHLEPDED
jgi:hypothetical protein